MRIVIIKTRLYVFKLSVAVMPEPISRRCIDLNLFKAQGSQATKGFFNFISGIDRTYHFCTSREIDNKQAFMWQRFNGILGSLKTLGEYVNRFENPCVLASH